MPMKPDPPLSGPSPRGRGSLDVQKDRLVYVRPIPAWAGEPSGPFRWRAPSAAHPRVGGGASSVMRAIPACRGPSPRGRGSQGGEGGHQLVGGPIPAWAGEPVTDAATERRYTAHPRVGGGAPWS